MSTRFFTNADENTLLKKFAGVFDNNPDIEWFDALVGYLRSSGYFALRPYLDKVPHIRILVGINVDAIMADYYTPRPIVHHLCREGLRVWLEQFPPSPARAAGWPKQLQTLLALDASDGLDETERATLESLLTPEEARSLLDRLGTFRACDLAVSLGRCFVMTPDEIKVVEEAGK
jgi:hypothetical protein